MTLASPPKHIQRLTTLHPLRSCPQSAAPSPTCSHTCPAPVLPFLVPPPKREPRFLHPCCLSSAQPPTTCTRVALPSPLDAREPRAPVSQRLRFHLPSEHAPAAAGTFHDTSGVHAARGSGHISIPPRLTPQGDLLCSDARVDPPSSDLHAETSASLDVTASFSCYNRPSWRYPGGSNQIAKTPQMIIWKSVVPQLTVKDSWEFGKERHVGGWGL